MDSSNNYSQIEKTSFLIYDICIPGANLSFVLEYLFTQNNFETSRSSQRVNWTNGGRGPGGALGFESGYPKVAHKNQPVS